MVQKLEVETLHELTLAPAADVTTLRLVIDSAKPPYTMLFRISNLSPPPGSVLAKGPSAVVVLMGPDNKRFIRVSAVLRDISERVFAEVENKFRHSSINKQMDKQSCLMNLF